MAFDLLHIFKSNLWRSAGLGAAPHMLQGHHRKQTPWNFIVGPIWCKHSYHICRYKVVPIPTEAKSYQYMWIYRHIYLSLHIYLYLHIYVCISIRIFFLVLCPPKQHMCFSNSPRVHPMAYSPASDPTAQTQNLICWSKSKSAALRGRNILGLLIDLIGHCSGLGPQHAARVDLPGGK